MPRKRKVGRQKTEYPVEARIFLETGNFGESFEIYLMLRSQEKIKNMWNSFRDDILADWIKQKPGSRPHGWWTHDSPGLRRRIGEKKSDDFHPGEVYVRGILVHEKGVHYESQAEYLSRINLLFPGEREKLTPKDFEPEVVDE